MYGEKRTAVPENVAGFLRLDAYTVRCIENITLPENW